MKFSPTHEKLVELVTFLLPCVKIDSYDDNMGTYRCIAECRPIITLEDPMELTDQCYHHGFPHTEECPLRLHLEALRVAVCGVCHGVGDVYATVPNPETRKPESVLGPCANCRPANGAVQA